MTNPILSICIPTYNRATYLKDALESIFIQLTPELSQAVEVVVADNASSDHTEQVVREFADKIDRLAYIKNPENVGFDGNVNIAVRAASGEYCWYLGDDDAIINGALSHMTEVCRQNRHNVMSVTDRPLTERPINNTRESYSEAGHIEGLSPSDNYLQGYLPSALSLLIFRRNDWLKVADFANHTPGWFYFETILKMAAMSEGKVLHIKKPMVLTGQDMRWADGGAGLKIFIDCNRFLYKMIDWDYDKTTIEKELTSNARRFPIVLLQAKVKGLPVSLKNLSLVQSFTTTAPFHTKLISNIIFFVPNPIVRFVRDIKKFFLKQ